MLAGAKPKRQASSAPHVTWAVHLTGDHEAMAAAELEAVAGPCNWLGPRVALVADGSGLERLGFLKEAGQFILHAPDQEGVIHATAQVVAQTARPGSQAVATLRTGAKSAHDGLLKRIWGAALARDHPIDLKAPEHVVSAWLHDGCITATWQALIGATDHELRGVEHRAHFQPVSLSPRFARALVNLTGCKPGSRIYDPFCGTGGILLEAAMMGFDAWGSDLDAWMVQGTLATLTDAGPAPLDGVVFQADIAQTPELVDGIDAIVTDMPYGGASTTNHEALASLYERAFVAFAKMLAPGARAVIGHADADLLAPVEQHGFVIEDVFEHYVHKSMTRRFAVVKRTD